MLSLNFLSSNMEEETHHNIAESLIYSSSSTLNGPSSSSQVQEERREEEEEQQQQQQQDRQQSNVFNRTNLSFSNLGSTDLGHEIWSCFTVLFTFWFFGQSSIIFFFFNFLYINFFSVGISYTCNLFNEEKEIQKNKILPGFKKKEKKSRLIFFFQINLQNLKIQI